MQKKKKAIIIFTISLLFAGLILVLSILNSINALFLITEGLDRPSKAYYILIERIYKLSCKKEVGKKIWGYVEANKNAHLHNLYIQVLGITGTQIPAGSLIQLYSLYQHDMNRRSTDSRIIDAMGLLGNEDYVPFLETLLRHYDQLKVQATQYAVLRSLYLITGNRYAYLNHLGQHSKLQLTDELIEARKVIEKSKGRSRTMQEMRVLDKLSRPPGW